MKRMNADMRESRRSASASKHDHHVKSSVRRTLTTFGVGHPKPIKPELTPQDVDAVVRLLNERWQSQMGRLAQFLERNNNIAAGVPGYGVDGESILSEETMRPSTALSDKGILEQVMSNTTPKIELSNPVESQIYSKTAALNISSEEKHVGEKGRMSSVAESDDEEGRPVTAKSGSPAMENEKLFDLRNTEGGMFVMDT